MAGIGINGQQLQNERIQFDNIVAGILKSSPNITVEEIAKELHKSVDTIKNSLYRISKSEPDPLLENAQYFCRNPKVHKWTDPKTGKTWDDVSEFFGVFGGYDL